MKKLGAITRIIGLIIKFAPIIITISEALGLVKSELEKIKNQNEDADKA